MGGTSVHGKSLCVVESETFFITSLKLLFQIFTIYSIFEPKQAELTFFYTFQLYGKEKLSPKSRLLANGVFEIRKKQKLYTRIYKLGHIVFRENNNYVLCLLIEAHLFCR